MRTGQPDMGSSLENAEVRCCSSVRAVPRCWFTMFSGGCLRRESGLQSPAWAEGHFFLVMMDLHHVLVLIAQEFEEIAYMYLGCAWVNGMSIPWLMELAMFAMLTIQVHRL